MVCSTCGATLQPDQMVCGVCGKPNAKLPTSILGSRPNATEPLEYFFLSQSGTANGALPTAVSRTAAPLQGDGPAKDIPNLTTALPPTSHIQVCRRCHKERLPGMRFCPACGLDLAPSPLEKAQAVLRQQVQHQQERARYQLHRLFKPHSFVRRHLFGLLASACLLVAGANLFWPITGTTDPTALAQAEIIIHLRSIEWLMLGLLSLAGGLYFKPTDDFRRITR